jgi:hypothetical protein
MTTKEQLLILQHQLVLLQIASTLLALLRDYLNK